MEEEAKFQDKLAQLNIDAENFEDPSIKFRAEVNGKSVAEMEALLSSLPYDGSLSAARAKNDLIAIQRIELFQYGQEEVDKAWRKKKKKKKEKLLHCLATEAKEKRKQLLASHTADAPQRRKNAEAAVKAKEVLQKVNQDMEILASALRRHLNAVSALERVISAHAKAANDIAEARTKIAEMEKKMKEAHIRAEEAEKSAKEAHEEKEKAHAEKEKAHAEKREAHAERERHEAESARALAEKEKAERALADALVKAAFHEQHHISWKEKAHKWASGAQMVSAAATPLRAVSDKMDEGEEACDSCGAVMRPGLKFCTSCGTPRGGGDNRSNSGDSKASEPSAAETTEEQKCSNCDGMIRPGLRFCTSCGTKVSSKRKESAADKRNEGGKTDGGGGRGDDGSGDSGELSEDDTEGMNLDDLLSTMDEHIEESGGAKKGASLVDHMKAVTADKTKANIMDTTEHEL